MIRLNIEGKNLKFNNIRGISLLRKLNPREKFKIAICKATGKKVIMQYEKGYLSGNGHHNWLCLHD